MPGWLMPKSASISQVFVSGIVVIRIPYPEYQGQKNNYQKISKYERITLRLGKNFLTPHDRSFFLSE